MIVAVIAFVVFMERAIRKISIQYPRRQVGMKVFDGGSSHLPIKVNPANVIPAIFASSLLLLPTTLATFSGNSQSEIMATVLAYFGPGQPAYLLFFTAMIVFFTFFYTQNVAFKTDEVAENLKNQNGFVPGIRPGKRTEEYLDYVVVRLVTVGSIYLAAVCFAAGNTARPVGDSVLFWRHVGVDYRFCHDGHDQPCAVASDRASV